VAFNDDKPSQPQLHSFIFKTYSTSGRPGILIDFFLSTMGCSRRQKASEIRPEEKWEFIVSEWTSPYFEPSC
jgi:hypothetical protein